MTPRDRRHYRCFGIAETAAPQLDAVERLHTQPLEPPAPRSLGARIVAAVMAAAGMTKPHV